MAASEEGHVNVVDKLLKHGATVDLLDKVANDVNNSSSKLTHLCSQYYV